MYWPIPLAKLTHDGPCRSMWLPVASGAPRRGTTVLVITDGARPSHRARRGGRNLTEAIGQRGGGEGSGVS
jgi:hypothetical protein